MAKTEGTALKVSNWKPRSWTPDRCAVWKALKDVPTRQAEFERWVDAEPDHRYPEHLSEEWKLPEMAKPTE